MELAEQDPKVPIKKNLQKPVLFIDELQILSPFLTSKSPENQEAVRAFFQWLVKMSKDTKKMHVVLSSSDYFACTKLLDLIDPSNFRYFPINHITDKKKLDDLWDNEISLCINKTKKHRWGRDVFGGRIVDLVQYAQNGDAYLHDKYAQEKTLLLQRLRKVPFPRSIWASTDWKFQRILDILLKEETHAISVEELIRKSGLSVNEIDELVSSNYLCKLPSGSLSDSSKLDGPIVQARTPLFLKCWADMKKPQEDKNKAL